MSISDWIAIFRTGTHTDSDGRTKIWTEEDLDKIVAQYNPEVHEAPVVIGHPKTDAPAWGWVEALKREGQVLYAKLKDLAPEFVEMVRRGLFKKRSVSLDLETLALRHIGFLGAMPPAVEGLPNIAFEAEREVMLIEFAATDEEKEAQKRRSRRYGIGIKEGGHVTKPGEWRNVPDEDFLDPVNYRYPCPDAEQTRAAASYWGMPRNRAQYTPEEQAVINRRLEAMKKKFKIGQFTKEDKMNVKEWLKSFFSKVIEDMPEDGLPEIPQSRSYSEAEISAREQAAADKAREEERKKVEAEFAERKRQEEEKQREEARAKRREETLAFCEGLAKEGKVLPAWMEMGLGAFMASLDDEETIEFSTERKEPRLAWFKAFLTEALPKVVDFKEVANREKDPGATDKSVQRQKLISEYMEKNPKAPQREAAKVVAKAHPDLFKEDE